MLHIGGKEGKKKSVIIFWITFQGVKGCLTRSDKIAIPNMLQKFGINLNICYIVS